jgi:hypothetical protein
MTALELGESLGETETLVHVLPEDQPRQLLDSYKVVCDALRHEAGQEPQFDNAKDIRHEIVWGLSPDHSVKYRLLGGMDGQPAQQVLVLTHNRARQGVTYTGAQATAIIRAHATVSRLSQLRDFGIDNLLNRSVKSAAEQDQLDGDRHKWLDEVVQLLRAAGAAPSDVSAVNRLGTYTPKNLQPLLGIVAGTVQPAEIAAISARNRKHRNEMAERLDRLFRAIRALEKP